MLCQSTSLIAEVGKEVKLFDGKSFEGWEFFHESEKKWWRIENETIIGGNLQEYQKQTKFLHTKKSYQNFELKFEVKLIRQSGSANSGVQIRSKAANQTMYGYQVDVGIGWWGKIYDEHRRKKVLTKFVDEAALKKVVEDWDWNSYRVIAKGNNIKTYINGVLAHDYTEKDVNIPLNGKIGLQRHSGGVFEVHYKNLTIKELPETAGVMTWEKAQKKTGKVKFDKAKNLASQTTLKFPIYSPEEQLKTFQLEDGFVAELVSSELQGAGKPVTVQWDATGRMWTMTAFEYPLDANERKAGAREKAMAKYKEGGKDKILYFDNPYGPGPHTPKTFTSGLVIPLACLPLEGGKIVYSQHGTEIRKYIDEDGDGKADRHEVILKGMGIDDSHLFPHQFERTPGGWIYCAQGLFNYSSPQRPEGKKFVDGSDKKSFRQTKLARFRPDGSMWENTTAGPNNIWGLIQKNNGEVFIQEANDMGLPVAEYLRGYHYRTGSREKLKPYAPQYVPDLRPMMGGTGLSGLALTENKENPFNKIIPDAENTFFVANPITNKIQIVSSTVRPNGHHEFKVERDFMVAGDKRFRPVAVHFGPDGCLYVVDWYNKIISHNEVSRSHPDRDKERGRIWRIRHKDQKVVAPPNLMTCPEQDLVKHLQSSNERIARFAWHAISDRKSIELKKSLEKLLLDDAQPENVRILAMWSLEDLGLLGPNHLKSLKGDKNKYVRFQVVRSVGEMYLSENDFLAILKGYTNDDCHRVRTELANSVRTFRGRVTPGMLELVARLGKAPLKIGGKWEKFDRLNERYVARWAMENNREATRAMLRDSSQLTTEQRLLAISTLSPKEAAIHLVNAIPKMDRSLTASELSIVIQQLSEKEIQAKLSEALTDRKTRIPLLQTILTIDAKITANTVLATEVVKISKLLVEDDSSSSGLVLALATKLRLSSLEELIFEWMDQGKVKLKPGLRALTEMESQKLQLFEKYWEHPDQEVQRIAVAGLAGMKGVKARDSVDLFAGAWPSLGADKKQIVVTGLTAHSSIAVTFADAILAGKFEGLSEDSYESLFEILGNKHPKTQALLKEIPGLLSQVLVSKGKNSYVQTDLDLSGAFTIEAWVKISGEANNGDQLFSSSGGRLNFNFFDGKPRLFAKGDKIVAKQKVSPNVWTHIALSRDDSGKLKIYFDGDLNAEGEFEGPMTNIQLLRSDTDRGNKMKVKEFRVWNYARSKAQILADFMTDYTAGEREEDLLVHLERDEKKFKRVNLKSEMTSDFPDLISPDQAIAAKKKFDRVVGLAMKKGDTIRGKAYFSSCVACHDTGEGKKLIGPTLSGISKMSVEAIVHNILTPNAKMESGYYTHEVITKEGRKYSGALVEETKQSLTIKPVVGEARVIKKAAIKKHKIIKRSLMPEGLIDHLKDEQITDLFEYMRTIGK